MRPRDLVPVALLGLIAVVIVVQGRNIKRPRRAATSSPAPVTTPRASPRATKTGDTASIVASDSTTVTEDSSGLIEVRRSGAPAPQRDMAWVREIIKEGSPGTYLPDILSQQGDMLFRWPERRIDALRVWVQRFPNLPDFQASYPVVAEQVFDQWREAGFPLRFDFVSDSTQAEISIRWAMSLPQEDSTQRRIGLTRKLRDENGWISLAELTISTHDAVSGAPLSPELVAGIVRHEVGHALGLGHSPNKSDVMYPESETQVISRADRATLHILYILPPGSVK